MPEPLALFVTLAGRTQQFLDGAPTRIGSGPCCELRTVGGPAVWAHLQHWGNWSISTVDSSVRIAFDGVPTTPLGSSSSILAPIPAGTATVVELSTGEHRVAFTTWLAARDSAPVAPPVAPQTAPPTSPRPDSHSHAPQPGRAAVVASRRIGRKPVVVGRAGGNATIQLDDATLAARHTTLQWNGRHLVIRDLNRGTGTYVGGRLVYWENITVGQHFTIGHFTGTVDASGTVEFCRLTGSQALDVSDVSVWYERSDSNVVHVLERVSFRLAQAESVGVIAGSGAGKSTLCAAILGEADRQSGRITLGDEELGHYPVNPNLVAFVPQFAALFDELSVAATMEYAARLRLAPDVTAAERDAAIRTAMARVRIDAVRNQSVGSLSGGQRRRLAIAVEMLAEPVLLMLDEPTSGLDEGLDRMVMRDLSGLPKSGTTVIVVTHSLAHLHLLDKVVALTHHKGVPAGVGYFGPPNALFAAFGAATGADVMDALSSSSTHAPGGHTSATSAPSPPARRPTPPRRRHRIGTSHALAALFRREIVRLTTGFTALRQLALLGLVYPAVVGSVAALLGPDGLSAGRRIPNSTLGTSVAVLTICLSFLSMALSLTSMVSDRAAIQRESRWGVPPSAVVLSRALARAGPAVVQAGAATATVIGWRSVPGLVVGPLPAWLGLWGMLSLLSITSMCIGLWLSSTAFTAEQAVGRMSAALAAMVVLCGLVVPLGRPSGFTWLLSVLSYLTPTRWAVAGTVSYVHGRTTSTLGPDRLWTSDAAHTIVPLGVLVVMATLSLIGATIALRRRPSPSGGRTV